MTIKPISKNVLDFMRLEYSTYFDEIRYINDKTIVYGKGVVAILLTLLLYLCAGLRMGLNKTIPWAKLEDHHKAVIATYGVGGIVLTIMLITLVLFALRALATSKRYKLRYWKCISLIRLYAHDPSEEDLKARKWVSGRRLLPLQYGEEEYRRTTRQRPIVRPNVTNSFVAFIHLVALWICSLWLALVFFAAVIDLGLSSYVFGKSYKFLDSLRYACLLINPALTALIPICIHTAFQCRRELVAGMLISTEHPHLRYPEEVKTDHDFSAPAHAGSRKRFGDPFGTLAFYLPIVVAFVGGFAITFRVCGANRDAHVSWEAFYWTVAMWLIVLITELLHFRWKNLCIMIEKWEEMPTTEKLIGLLAVKGIRNILKECRLPRRQKKTNSDASPAQTDMADTDTS